MNEILDFLANNEMIILLVVTAFLLIIIALVLVFAKEEKFSITTNEDTDFEKNESALDTLVEIEEIKETNKVTEVAPEQPQVQLVEAVEPVEVKKEQTNEEYLENTMSRLEPINEIKYVEEGLEKTQALFELEKITEELKKREKAEIEEIKKLIPEEIEIEETSGTTNALEPEVIEVTEVVEKEPVQMTIETPEIIEVNEAEPEVVEIEETIPELSLFEQEQEENAIISLDEYLQLGERMHESNEFEQYEDEGDIPITIEELEARMKGPIQLAAPVQTPETIEIEEAVKEDIVEPVKVKLDDFNTIEPTTIESIAKSASFRTTPFISPVYGREEKEHIDHTIQLENTANYEKLDEEIRKTNEFLNTLKELQKKLD